MSDLVGNPEDRFSRVAAHIKVVYEGVFIARICFPDDFRIGANGVGPSVQNFYSLTRSLSC